MAFGKRLKELREAKGLTQGEFSKLISAGQSTIGMYETDKRKPDIETIKQLADFFNVTTDYLLSRTDDPHGYRIETTTVDDPTSALPEDARKSIEEFKKFIFEKYGIKYD